jgi:MOSC domain-containing protein YiiM
MTPVVLALNIAPARPVPWGTVKRSAIDKRPVEGELLVSLLGVEGDEQADKENHGGVDQAVYAYAREDLDRWGAELGRELSSGCFGENLTTGGVDVNGAIIGERWRIGEVLLEVTSPRIPCAVFAGFIGEPQWMKRFTQAQNPGTYFRVLVEGKLKAGDSVAVEHRPSHGITVRDVFRAKTGDRSLIPRLLEAPQLSAHLKAWAKRRLAEA